MNDIYQSLTENLYLFLALVIIIDALPIAGMIIPDEIAIAFAGFIIAQNSGSMIFAITLSVSLLLLTQLIMYWLGAKYSNHTINWLNKKSPKLVIAVEKYLNSNDLLVNILLRFTSSIRAVYAFISGIRKYDINKFVAYEIFVSTLKSILYLSIGYFIAQSVEEVESLTQQVGYMIAAIVVIAIGISIYSTWRIMREV
jgi:membrane protein DedA with SNARE-associated domain